MDIIEWLITATAGLSITALFATIIWEMRS
jgi:hypothetical protein